MSAETPRCRRERIASELNDGATSHHLHGRRRGEGAHDHRRLLVYLPAATVEALAAEAWQDSGIAHWMSDIMTTAFSKAINMEMWSLRNLQASDSLQGEQIRRRPPERLGDCGAAELYHRCGICHGARSAPDGRSAPIGWSATGPAGRSDGSALVWARVDRSSITSAARPFSRGVCAGARIRALH